MATRTQNPSSSTTNTSTTTSNRAPQAARPGFISHTEFASRDPAATRAFCEKVFGWTFETQEGPTGPYHLFRFEGASGGSGGSGASGGINSNLHNNGNGSSRSSPGSPILNPSDANPPTSGGGIRGLGKAEPPLAIPYVEVEDLRQAEVEATRAGGKVITPRVSMGNGSILVLQLPGGPHVGLWAPN